MTVRGAADQLRALAQEVVHSTRLPAATKGLLLGRLNVLLAGLEAERPLARPVACIALDGFEAAVRRASERTIPTERAQAWTADARRIRAVLAC